EKLGFFEGELRKIEKAIFKPNGMILICGPTGCGKTTTLYSFLKKINPERRNIMTIEDPVEYELPGVNQQQINVRAGIDFASGLKSMLRQDPDVIMVGEIRDAETAKIANQAADTGHLVLSTVHSVDTANVISRLRYLGIDPHYISSSLLAIIAQRLVRTLCLDCKEEIKNHAVSGDKALRNIYKPKGCLNCNYTGYRGRTGIFETLVINEELRGLIYRDASPGVIRNNYAKWGIESLRQKGIKKVLNGETTFEELDAVVSEAKFSAGETT
ncbi:MAG: GspE/PulE family protein, partial [Candidatus Omnitrophota bacterium]|nr:GspE/PulE family protein [Candidatus Omnitrophota bacterium]